MKNHTSKKHLIIVKLYTLGLVSMLFYTGCGSPRGELFVPLETPLVWPEPPEKPRVRYVGAISTEADLKREISWSQSLTDTIFGKKDIGVLMGPYAVTIDSNERLYVADASSGVVHMFDLDSRRYKQFAALGRSEKLLMPVALALVGNKLYVVDSKLHKVCVFDKEGKFKFTFGRDRFKRPSGIAYWPATDKLYVAETGEHLINVFSRTGKFLQQIGSRGLNPGHFNFPTHLWIDKLGRLYVSDTLNYRIQVFSSEGKFFKIFGQQGDRPGNFAHPCGVATDSFGNIYVTDRQFENVQIFDSDGRILMAFGQEGSELGQFWLPAGICIDNRNRIYVADSFNKRIQIFELLRETSNEK